MVAIPNKENDRISAVDSSKRLPVAQAVKTLRRALPPCPVGKPPRRPHPSGRVLRPSPSSVGFWLESGHPVTGFRSGKLAWRSATISLLE